MPVLKNPRHEAFAQLRAKGKSSDDAYEAAGYKPNRGNAARLNAKESVRARISELQSAGAERTEVTVGQVITELARIGFADIRNAVEWGGVSVQLKDSNELDEATAAAISEVALTQSGLKIKLHDKLSALEKLGKHLGMFNGSGGDDEEAKPMTFNINVNAPVGDVRVTKPE